MVRLRPYSYFPAILLVLIAICVATPSAASSIAMTSQKDLNARSSCPPSYVPGEVLVKFRKHAKPETKAIILRDTRWTLKSICPAGGENTFLLRLGRDTSVMEYVHRLKQDPDVEFVEPNYLRQPLYTPSDPYFPLQWGLSNTGQEISGVQGTPGADISATRAWDLERGNTNPITVAVIDTGINPLHPDLDSQIWANVDEIPGNGIDDDGNGYVDDSMGYNWTGISQRNYGYWESGTWHVMYREFGAGPDSEAFAQSITGTGCELTHVGLSISKVNGPTGDIKVSVRTDLSGPDLGSYTISASEVGDSPAEIYKQLSTPLMLQAGNAYFLVFETSKADDVNHYCLYENQQDKSPWGYLEGKEFLWDGSQWNDCPSNDFYFRTNTNSNPYDDHSHGTFVSGIIAAEHNNEGIAGVSPGAKIMPLKIVDSTGNCTSADLCSALHYAADNGARVINMSLGGNPPSAAEQEAINYAHSKGAILFAAAGNYGDATIWYPAGYQNVVGVGATTNQDQKAYFSETNSSVDIAAPGQSIFTTGCFYGEYYFVSGTSAATAFASGLAALVLSARPRYSTFQVERVIEANAADLGDRGRDDWYGYGRIDAYRTLLSALTPKIFTLNPPFDRAGTLLAITGESFGNEQGASNVIVGSVRAKVVSWADDRITCRTPDGIHGTVPVIVTTPIGASEPAYFKVRDPKIFSVSPISGAQGQTMDVTIAGTETAFVNGTSMAHFGEGITVNSTSVSDATHASANITISASAIPGSREINVTTGGETPDQLTGIFRVNSKNCTWYLAEGTTNWGFDTSLNIENPNPATVTAKVTYETQDGARARPDISLPPMSRTTLNPRDDIGGSDFSTKVECLEGKAIAVDRTMVWKGAGAQSQEGHSSIGVTAPAKTWYLAEGSSNWGFECWLTVGNPNAVEATCEVTYMIEGRGAMTVSHKVPANTRRSYSMTEEIGAGDASIEVSSNVPVVVERSMYRNNRREGHNSVGTTSPSNTFYLAEGSTAWGFSTYLLVQNPSSSPTNISVTYMTPEGSTSIGPILMPPRSRKTFNAIDQVGKASDISIRVDGDDPIIAERAMYWGAGTRQGEACHDSIGIDSPHLEFFLPDGETKNGVETWTIVQNPNPSPVNVEISYLTPSGKGNKVFRETVPANSRRSFSMADKLPDGRAAVMVRSKTAGKPVIVERAMYWNHRGAGTDTMGGYSD